MLKGDVGLGTHVRDLRVSTDGRGVRGSAQNLHHDGLLGSAESLHRLLMGGLGELFAIDLEEETSRNMVNVNNSSSLDCPEWTEGCFKTHSSNGCERDVSIRRRDPFHAIDYSQSPTDVISSEDDILVTKE